MSLTYSQLLLLALALSPVTALAAPSQESLAREYEQVRKIALRDPKVRAAYAAADQRLDAKIVSIDPTLASYVKTRGKSTAETTGKPAPAAKPTSPKTAAQPRREISHVVARGDTLSSIAAKYQITVPELRKANNIQDERRLPVGQTLNIPKPSGGSHQ